MVYEGIDASGHKAIYSARIDIPAGAASVNDFGVLDTTQVAAVGGKLHVNGSPAANPTITDLNIYDAVNTKGQIGFYANTDQGAAIVRATPSRRPVFIIPGIGGTFPTPSYVNTWYLNRGLPPDEIAMDPLTHVYDDLIRTFVNAGYTLNKDLFLVTYDWRVPPAPTDGTPDGHISGLTGSSIANSPTYQYGVDYLGHFLKYAADSWNAAHPDEPLDSVNVIAHSTGGLVTRAYIQSDAYGDVYNGVDHLPKIDQFVEYDVPNFGASKAWNILHDNFGIDFAYKYVLRKIVSAALAKVEAGALINNPNGTTIGLSNTLTNGQVDPEKFLNLYIPTIRALLATYPFIDDGQGHVSDVNSDPAERNDLGLDLNGGTPGAWANDLGHLDVIYGNGVSTPTTVTKVLTADPATADPQYSITEKLYHYPAPGTFYYHENYTTAGDATVPLASAQAGFTTDTDQVTLLGYQNGVNTTGDVSHTGIVSNPDVEMKILNMFGYVVKPNQISTGHASPLYTNAGNIAALIVDPSEAVVTDAQGRRFGYTQATGPLTEIPGSEYIGGADGFGLIFGPVDGPLTLTVDSLGSPYHVELVGEQDGLVGGTTLTGSFPTGQQQTAVVTFAPVPANNPPVLAAIPNQAATEGSPLTFTASATDQDAGQTLTYSLDPGAPSGAVIDPTTGLFTFTPGNGPASYSVTVRATDNGSPALGDARSFTITVANVAPTVSAGGAGTATAGTAFTRSGSFTDPGAADSWTATVNYGDGSGDQVLALNADKTFALAHTYAAAGGYPVKITVTDAGGDPGTASFNVAVAVPNLQSIDLGTPASAADWKVTGAGATAAPAQQSGPRIGLTDNGFSTGTFLPGGSAAQFNGLWYADRSFTLPAGASNVTLTFSGLSGDDRVVLQLNGHDIGNVGISGSTGRPITGQGVMLFPGATAEVPYSFTSTVGGTVTSFFNPGGTNVLRLVVNNTGSGLGGRTASFLTTTDWSTAGVTASVTYTAAASAPTIGLAPAAGSTPIGQTYTVTATVADPNGAPLASVPVTFTVTGGPDAGTTSTITTDAAGRARYSYANQGGRGPTRSWRASSRGARRSPPSR